VPGPDHFREPFAPENTSRRDPLTNLLGIMGEGQSEYITGMKEAGQRQVVASSVMPADAPWADRPSYSMRAPLDGVSLESLGFAKGEPVKGDPLFVQATLPEGWKKEGSDHAMWSHVVDERGVQRVGIFYKAAFYDRSAHAHLVDVGYAAASEVIYGEEPVGLPKHWAVLTADERDRTVAALRSNVEEAKKYPGLDSTQQHAARAQELLDLMGLPA